MENWEGMTIGQRILTIRGKEPRHSFAKSLGIGTATLQRYEGDERQPDVSFLTALQELTGYSLDYLVYGKESGNNINNTNLNPEEQLIIEKYRTASEQTRRQLLLMLLAGENTLPHEPNSSVFNNTGQNHIGSQVHAQGDVALGDVVMK